MPRLSAIRSAPLRALHEQQRFTPRDTLLKHVARAEALAGEINPDVEYPEDWIAFRITGYRPDLDAPALVNGAALLADLSALVEHFCDTADLRQADLPPGACSIEQLAHTWNVTRRTIERYRRRGLVARRWRDEESQVRLVFAPAVIDAFEHAHGAVIKRAAAFSRVNEDESSAIAQAASQARRHHPEATPTELARHVAQASGRSLPAVRRALDEAAPTIATTGAAKLSRCDARRVARAFAFGVRPGEIAERYRCTRLTVHRVALREQARRLQRALRGVPITDEPIELETDHPFVAHAPPITPLLESRAFVEAARADEPIDAETEHALLSAHRALLERAAAILAGMDPARPNQRLLDRAETDLRWALRLRARALDWQRALIVRTIESRAGTSLRDLAPHAAIRFHETASLAAIDAIARFDPRRGGRLAARVSIAADRALAALHMDDMLLAPDAALPRITLIDVTDRLAPWRHLVAPHPKLPAILPGLKPLDAQLLATRYALPPIEPPAHPLTVPEVLERFDVTPARIIGAWRRARRAIRAHLA